MRGINISVYVRGENLENLKAIQDDEGIGKFVNDKLSEEFEEK